MESIFFFSTDYDAFLFINLFVCLFLIILSIFSFVIFDNTHDMLL